MYLKIYLEVIGVGILHIAVLISHYLLGEAMHKLEKVSWARLLVQCPFQILSQSGVQKAGSLQGSFQIPCFGNTQRVY